MHQFSVKTFLKPTYCEHCSGLLWGLARQGVSCSQCHLNMHKNCASSLGDSLPCVAETFDFDQQSNADSGVAIESTAGISSIVNDEKLVTEKSSESKDSAPSLLRRRSLLFNLTSAVRRNSSVSRKSLADIKTASLSQAPPQISVQKRSGSVIHDLLEKTAEKAEELKKKQPPKLNLLTTLPKNFSRFVMRVGPMAGLQNRIENVFAWKSPTETLLVMALYTLVCLNPFLLVLIPNLLIIGLIANNYYKNVAMIPNNKRQHRSNKSDVSSKSADSGKQNITNATTATNSVPDEINYTKNMQFIQNFMGLFCEIYESVISLNKWLNWSDPSRTKNVLLATIASSFALLFVFTWIPWNIIFLFAGLGAFCSNAAFVHAMADMSVNSVQHFVETFKEKRYFSLLEAYPTENDVSDTQTVTIAVYENQRWWAGLGWISHMLKNERNAWSDADGKHAFKPKDSHSSPSKLVTTDSSEVNSEWKWTGEWQVDRQHEEDTDEEGWRYTDHKWLPVDKRCGGAFVTRSRRWIRQAIPNANAPIPNANANANDEK